MTANFTWMPWTNLRAALLPDEAGLHGAVLRKRVETSMGNSPTNPVPKNVLFLASDAADILQTADPASTRTRCPSLTALAKAKGRLLARRPAFPRSHTVPLIKRCTSPKDRGNDECLSLLLSRTPRSFFRREST